jgi:hypothetical protein
MGERKTFVFLEPANSLQYQTKEPKNLDKPRLMRDETAKFTHEHHGTWQT